MAVFLSNPAVLNETHWFFIWSVAILALELIMRWIGMFLGFLTWITIFLVYLSRVHRRKGDGAKSPRDHLLCAILDLALILASFVGNLWLIGYVYLTVDPTKEEYQGKVGLSVIATEYLIVKLFLTHTSIMVDLALIYMILHIIFAPLEWIFNEII